MKNEKKQQESEKKYRTIFEYANDGIIIHYPDGKIIDVNKNMYTRLGYTKEEMLKMSLRDLVSSEHSRLIRERTSDLESKGIAIFESADKRKDGTVMPVEVSARYMDYDGQKVILSVVRDITKRKMAEDLILSTLKDKEVLTKEIQHRVNDNFNIISDSFRPHIKCIKDKNIRQKYKANLKRIKTMSFIHDKIYRSINFYNIDFSDFLRKLITHLFSTHRVGIMNVRLKQEADDVYLDIHRAIPCGLIINELISNSLDHAFPEDRQGEINLMMKMDKNGKYSLTIKDNGIGFPKELNYRKTKSFGLKLVIALVDQINGNIRLDRRSGTKFQIIF